MPDEIDAIVDAIIERGSPTLDRIIAERDELRKELAQERALVRSWIEKAEATRAATEALLVLNQDLRAEVERRSEQHEIDNGVQEKLYEERDDALHQAERLAHEVERLQRENGALARTYALAEEKLRGRTEALNEVLAQNERFNKRYRDAEDTVATWQQIWNDEALLAARVQAFRDGTAVLWQS